MHKILVPTAQPWGKTISKIMNGMARVVAFEVELF